MINEYVAPVDDLLERDALSEWRWLVGEDAAPLLLTAMGDMFITRPSTGVVDFIDSLEGAVHNAAGSYEEFKRVVNDTENFAHWFLPELVLALRERGLVLGVGQCYSPIHHPALGGALVPENIEVTLWRVHFAIAGQIHEQTKDLPEGTKIDRILVNGRDLSEKPWWKFW